MKTYTVVAIYADDNSRYATSVLAESPEQAEDYAQQICAADNRLPADSQPLIIAGVLEGEVMVVG